ncbi:MAG: DUF5009 domain-containing protein [Tatlockia sp.]|jgi:predicted acyltransferase
MKSTRLLSLDVFRGITIAGMILVNSPGNQTAWFWLQHSAWNGCTFADLVFPFFLFMVGLTTVFSLAKTRLPTNQLILKIAKRSLIIFSLGIFLNAFPAHFDFASLRYYGVLQRIAICYFFSAILTLTTGVKTQGVLLGILLLGYWVVMTIIPGQTGYSLTPDNNLAASWDRALFNPPHLYGKTYDPEGFLSTFPALATTLLGNLTGAFLLTKKSNRQKLKGLVIAGSIALFTGYVASFWFPLNKTLWTSSYVLWTGGLALYVFAFCYYAIEIKEWKKWSLCFEILGVNALAVYVLHVFFLKVQMHITVGEPGAAQDLKSYITNALFGWTSLENASFLYALLYLLFWLIVLAILYKKKIFIKI